MLIAAAWTSVHPALAVADQLPPALEAAIRTGTAPSEAWTLTAEQSRELLVRAADNVNALYLLAQYNESKPSRAIIAAYCYRAYLIVRPDDPRRPDILRRIEALERRTTDMARSLVGQAQIAARGTAGYDYRSALDSIGGLQARLGDFAAAYASADAYRRTESYGPVPTGILRSIATTQAMRGDLAGADETLRRLFAMNDSYGGPGARLSVIDSLISAGRLSDALRFLGQVPSVPSNGRNPWDHRITASIAIMDAFQKAGDQQSVRDVLQAALRLANSAQGEERANVMLRLAASAVRAGDLETAMRLFQDALRQPPSQYYRGEFNRNRWAFIQALTENGHPEEAAVLLLKSPANEPGDTGYRDSRGSAFNRFEDTWATWAGEAVTKKKLAEFEGQLVREPWPGAYTQAHLKLAVAYKEKGDLAGAWRNADAAAKGFLSHSVSSDTYTQYGFTSTPLSLADLLIGLGDLAAARQIVETTKAIVDKLSKPEYYPSSYLAGGYAKLAAAQAAAGKIDDGKNAVREIYRIANRTSKADDRVNLLSNLAGLDPRVANIDDFAKAAEATPGAYGNSTLATGLVKSLAEAGQDDKARAVTARMTDTYYRESSLRSVIAQRAAAGNWAAAKTFAEDKDPAVAGQLSAELAGKLLQAGRVEEAVALEARFKEPSSQADSYYAALAGHHARAADFEAARKAAERASTGDGRIQNLAAIANAAYAVGGPVAARPIVERLLDQGSRIKSAVEQAKACNAALSSFTYGSILGDGVPGGSDQLGAGCLAEVFALPAVEARKSYLWSTTLSYQYAVTHPLFSAVSPLRPALSRYVAEEAERLEPSFRDVGGRLIKEGAIEAGLELAGPLVDYAAFAYRTAAVDWLVEAGDTEGAQRLVDGYIEGVSPLKAGDTRDYAFQAAVTQLVKLGAFERAFKAADEISSLSSRASSFLVIANAAVARGQFDAALNAVDRAKVADDESPQHYSRYSIVSAAAAAGDKRMEAMVDELDAQKSPYALSARDTVLRALLKWKRPQRTAALVDAQEAAIAHLPADSRWSNAASFAGILAQLGDTVRIDRLVADAPAAGNKVAILQSAAAGYVAAGKPEQAAGALDQLLPLVDTVPSTADRSRYLQSAAATRVNIGDVDAARQLLAQSLAVLDVSRSDAEGWTETQIATAQEAGDPEQAGRRALAIADPHWRARAVATLAAGRIAGKRAASGAALLQSAESSELLDPVLVRYVRTTAAVGDVDVARALAGKIAHPGVRDDARRQLALIAGRKGKVEFALAEIDDIKDPGARGYALVDLGAFLATLKEDAASQYFAQVCGFVAWHAAETVSDPLVKADLLAYAAHSMAVSKDDNAETVLQTAVGAADALPAGPGRDYARIWARWTPSAMKVDAIANSEARSNWLYEIKSFSENNLLVDPEAFGASLTAKNPKDRVYALTQAASSLLDNMDKAHKMLAAYEAKRKEAKSP